MKKYIPSQIESKWQQKWKKDNLYKAQNNSLKPKKYILDMFPYPSGDGLHVGHFKGYVATDILSRYFRMRGFNLLHPMGWDAFGLPAENYAIKTGIHPKITTAKNIAKIKSQMQMVGLSYDWTREINTTDPNYYKWTQWIFLKLFEHGLAYEDEVPINWCPKDKTGLANEEVVNGRCERCGAQVERKTVRQWILRITKYADRLLEDLEELDWPKPIKDMQTNWIGRSEGTLIKFDIESRDYYIETFTTRIDTVIGVTALILGPEHSKVSDLTTPENKKQVEAYLKKVSSKTDLERTQLTKDKTGVFTGSYAINPINKAKIPIWIADYVLGFYGSGALMLVPAHDKRDFEFANKFGLEIKKVIERSKKEKLPFIGEGILVNSSQFNGLDSNQAKKLITKWLKERSKGDFKIEYKLRDWIFSRQRYWGEPIPIIHCQSCGLVPLPESELPLFLPDAEKYQPTGTGQSPLASIHEWVNVDCPKCGGAAKRETNTMPQWAGSCWYYLRFCDPKNDYALISKDIEKYWLPVDWYIGGAEHAVLHLLYARFWHKFLFDIGIVGSSEPFLKLTNVGLVLAADGRKMSKSLGNVVTPDQIVKEYGADSLRVYEAFMGPFENIISWDPTSINGVYRFLTRVWEIVGKDSSSTTDQPIEIVLNRLINKVGSDIERMKFNTAIASLMEFINLSFHKSLTNDQKKRFLILLAPFAPHISEELWQQLGETSSVHLASWPKADNKYLKQKQLIIVVQVNGKVRESLLISSDIVNNESDIVNMALNSLTIQRFLNGQKPKKVFYKPGKILSLVV